MGRVMPVVTVLAVALLILGLIGLSGRPPGDEEMAAWLRAKDTRRAETAEFDNFSIERRERSNGSYVVEFRGDAVLIGDRFGGPLPPEEWQPQCPMPDAEFARNEDPHVPVYELRVRDGETVSFFAQASVDKVDGEWKHRLAFLQYSDDTSRWIRTESNGSPGGHAVIVGTRDFEELCGRDSIP